MRFHFSRSMPCGIGWSSCAGVIWLAVASDGGEEKMDSALLASPSRRKFRRDWLKLLILDLW